MAAHEKLLKRMRRSLADWGQDDLRRLYTGYGFAVREGGNHTFYTHPKYPQLTASVARHNSLAKGYVSTAIENIDSLLELENQEQQRETEASSEGETNHEQRGHERHPN